MSLNEKVISNLEHLYETNYKLIQHFSIGHCLDALISWNPDAFSFDEQKIVKLYDESTIKKFELAKENSNLAECFLKAIELSIDETKIIDNFSNDLKASFLKIKKGVKDHNGSKIQIIFLTYDYEPYAWISGFGEGNYPVLQKPEYFDFCHQKDFFEILGRVDYSLTWDNLIQLDECLESTEICDDVFDSDMYQSIRNCYIYKTYLLLNKAFKKNENELFADLNIKMPLFIYGHEHDCEKLNIYCFE